MINLQKVSWHWEERHFEYCYNSVGKYEFPVELVFEI